MGRPPGRIQDRLFQMRLSGEFLERLDDWRCQQPDLPSRAEAIRRLTASMLQILKKDPGEKGRSQKKRKVSNTTSEKSIQKVSVGQIKAARALLDWSQEKLASAAVVSVPTIKRLEAQDGPLRGRTNTGEKIEAALEEAGVVFIDENGEGPGVRLRKRVPKKSDIK
jgi:ribosome-binding protein aMBF1 (putative translation factor)